MAMAKGTKSGIPKPVYGYGSGDGAGAAAEYAGFVDTIDGASPYILGVSVGCSYIEQARATIGSTAAVLVVPPGTWYVTNDGTSGGTPLDVAIPANIHVVVQEGATINIGTVSLGNITAPFTTPAGTWTITTSLNTPIAQVSGTGNLSTRPGSWIKTNGGNYYQVYYDWSANAYIFLATIPTAAEPTVSFKTSPVQIGAASGLNALKPGYFVYASGVSGLNPIIIGRQDSDTVAYTMDYVNRDIDSPTAATRSVCLFFAGGITAGRYQIFTGDGVAQFSPRKQDFAFPEWWGALANQDGDVGTATNALAITKATFCFRDSATQQYHLKGGEVILAPSIYGIKSEIVCGPAGLSGVYGQGAFGAESARPGIAAVASTGYTYLSPWLIRTYPGNVYNTPSQLCHRAYQLSGHGLITPSKHQVTGIILDLNEFGLFEDIHGTQLEHIIIMRAGVNASFNRIGTSGANHHIILSSMEGEIKRVMGAFGEFPVTNGKFAASTDWTGFNTDWVWSDNGNGTGNATHQSGNTTSLSQSIFTNNGGGGKFLGATIFPTSPIGFRVKTTAGGAGGFKVKLFGRTILDLSGSAVSAGTYFWFRSAGIYTGASTSDPWLNTMVEIIPDSGYTGAIQEAIIHYGTGMYGLFTQVVDSDIYSDGGEIGDAAAACGILSSGAANAIISRNAIHPVFVGLSGYGQFIDNIIGDGSFSVCDVLSDSRLSGNRFDKPKQACFWLYTDVSGIHTGTIAENNTFYTNAAVAAFRYPDTLAVSTIEKGDGGATARTNFKNIFRNNTGVDVGAIPTLQTGSSPAMIEGKVFTTADTANLINPHGMVKGQDYTIYFTAARVLKFSDVSTPTNLKNLSGSTSDVTTKDGTMVKAFYDGTYLWCNVYNSA